VTSTGQDSPAVADELATTQSFADLGVADDLVAVLDAAEITAPFPIQALTIPDALEGRDVTGKAKTGSGKTLAFGLPMAQRLSKAKKGRPRALVLVPTRELANQVAEDLDPLVRARSLSLVAVYGGASMRRQIDAVGRGVEIVVATPGRLIDLMQRGVVRLGDVEIVTIDEADQMADMGFLPQVRRIMRSVEADHQTMLFSATLDGAVGALIRSYMHDPIFHEVASATETVETMEHRFLKVHHMDKVKVAAAIARSAERTLMFVRTKVACDKVTKELRDLGVAARAIHGDLPQRMREKALGGFADGRTPVLVATNVAARGLHVEGVDIVLHYDPPDDPKTYLHRSGRTARAGESGLVVTLVEWDQVNEVIRIQRRAGLNIPIVKMFSNDERLGDLATWDPPEDEVPFRDTTGRRLHRRRRRRL
jgi:superfamily II DNA/RNA helicase